MGITQLQADENSKPVISRKPGFWFWLAILLGLAIRIYFVTFTEGAYDVGIKQKHASGILELGLTGYYHSNIEINHPPFVGEVFYLMLRAEKASGIPFRVFLRAPFAILDGCTALLLFSLVRRRHHPYIITACYWLNPLAMIFSAYHGNTDSAVAFFLILCLWLLSKEKLVPAAIVMGLSLWVKLPATIALPAFLFFLQGWRKRLLFLAITGIVGISTYIPSLLEDAAIVCRNVFGYHGQFIQTTAGVPIWGTRVFLAHILQILPFKWQGTLLEPLEFLVNQSWRISILLIILFIWLRRSHRTVEGLGITIAGIYTILFGFSNYWSFQYFAWSIPFWFFAPPAFFITATLLAGGYIYLLYWFLCGSPWLLGKWDFAGQPYWPPIVITFRNLSILFFFLSACIFLAVAVYQQIERWRKAVI